MICDIRQVSYETARDVFVFGVGWSLVSLSGSDDGQKQDKLI